jgi:hypothetical protein
MDGLSFLTAWVLTAGLTAGSPVLHVVDVVRDGLPPYEPGQQRYVLDGGQDQGLRVGELLHLQRDGDPRSLGWLKVIGVEKQRSEARLAMGGITFILKGDLATPSPLPPLPPLDVPDAIPPEQPRPPKARPVPPPWEGCLFFLPHQDDLSPAGRRKLAEWVAEWGAGGQWTLQVPRSASIPAALRMRRATNLRAILAVLGVPQASLDERPRKAPGPYDPVWVRCQD